MGLAMDKRCMLGDAMRLMLWMISVVSVLPSVAGQVARIEVHPIDSVTVTRVLAPYTTTPRAGSDRKALISPSFSSAWSASSTG
jgi:hypothetical protein